MRATTTERVRLRRTFAPEPLEPRALLSADMNAYAIGTPKLQDVWVDPVHGNDDNSGATRSQAVQHVFEAWNRIPPFQTLDTVYGTGYRIQLVAGDYAHNSFESTGWTSERRGTYTCPVIINAADGPLTARVHATLNCQDDSYLYMIGLDFVTDPGGAGGGNVVQLASDDHVLLRSCRLNGFDGTTREPQETLKANQCQYVYVESCDVGGAFWFGLDFVAVQYGHILNTRVHDTGDDGLVLKGGSADITVAGCTIEDVGNVGFAAGQGSGLEWMVAPWVHYEAYDVKFVDNVVRNVQNAGMAVRGGYNILLADNTLYRVGLSRGSGSSQLLFSPGDRSCDGDTATCRALHNLGAWGPTAVGDAGEVIPNRNVYVYDNVIDNPAGSETMWGDLTVFAPVAPPPGLNLPPVVRSDDNLQIKGNVFWNGTAGHDLGANDPASDARLRADNAVGRFEPQMVDPAHGDFRPKPGGNLAALASVPVPDFAGGDLPAAPKAPQGDLSNLVAVDRLGASRTPTGTPGAIVAAVPVVPPPPPPPDLPSDMLMHLHNGRPYPAAPAGSGTTSGASVSSPLVVAPKPTAPRQAAPTVPAAVSRTTPGGPSFAVSTAAWVWGQGHPWRPALTFVAPVRPPAVGLWSSFGLAFGRRWFRVH